MARFFFKLMSGKLLADLQAQGIQSLSFNSLNELKWKTKRSIYMSLMAKREDRASALGRIRTLEEDRKIEKQVEREQVEEERIATIIDSKRRLMSSIVQEDDPKLNKIFSREELIDLLKEPG